MLLTAKDAQQCCQQRFRKSQVTFGFYPEPAAGTRPRSLRDPIVNPRRAALSVMELFVHEFYYSYPAFIFDRLVGLVHLSSSPNQGRGGSDFAQNLE